MRIIRLILFLSIFSTPIFGQNNTPQTVIWRTIIQNIIDKNVDSLIKYVSFPLSGDWAYMAGLKKDSEKASKQDFIKSFNKIFIPELIADFKKQNSSKIEKSTSDGKTEYTIGAGYYKIIDGFKDEEGMILRIKKIKGIYKLYLIQGVS